MHDRLRARIRGAGLRVSFLRGSAPAPSPSDSRKLTRESLEPIFQSDAVTLPLCGNEGRCNSARFMDACSGKLGVEARQISHQRLQADLVATGPSSRLPMLNLGFASILDSSRFSLVQIYSHSNSQHCPNPDNWRLQGERECFSSLVRSCEFLVSLARVAFKQAISLRNERRATANYSRRFPNLLLCRKQGVWA